MAALTFVRAFTVGWAPPLGLEGTNPGSGFLCQEIPAVARSGSRGHERCTVYEVVRRGRRVPLTRTRWCTVAPLAPSGVDENGFGESAL